MEPVTDIDEILKVDALMGFTNDCEKQAQLSAPMQALHRAVLRAFLGEDAPPTVLWLNREAERLSLDPDEAIGVCRCQLGSCGW